MIFHQNCFQKVRPLLFFTLFLIPTLSPAQAGARVPHPMEDLPATMHPTFSTTPEVMTLVGPRNGFASGQVVLRGADPRVIRMEDLQNETGARYPGNLFSVQFLVREVPQRNWDSERFEGILPELPRGVSADPFLPVHLSTQIPAQTPPGTYRGFLNAGGVRVPVELRVPEFVIPSPAQWQSWVHVVHIPEAVALMYGEDLWSDAHFQRIVPSLQRLAEIGNNVFHIPVERGTHFGNDHGMLVFREEGGRYVPDFQFVEQFLRLIQQHNGPPRVLWLYLFEPQQGPGRERSQREARITTINRQGRLGDAVIPGAGMGPADDTWRAVIQGMRQRIQALGWDPNILMVGSAGDARPERHMAEFFNRFDPPVQWVVFSHWRGDPGHNDRPVTIDHGMNVGFAETPYIIGSNQRDLLGGGWGSDPVVPWITSFRGSARNNSDLVRFRFMPDLSVHGRYGGFGRMALDGWRVPPPGGGDIRPTWMRARHSWYRLVRGNTHQLTVPGPDGAAPTLRHTQIREGAQEAEARITLERLLRQGGQADLDAEIREFLKDWNAARYFTGGSLFTVQPDWADRSTQLYALAARAAAVLGDAPAPVTAAIPVPPSPNPQLRPWTSRDGRQIEAAFARYDDRGIHLVLADGRPVTVSPSQLREADVNWVRAQTGFRTWTHRSGNQVEAALVSRTNTHFTLRNLAGQESVFPIADFSEEDQQVIRGFEP